MAGRVGRRGRGCGRRLGDEDLGDGCLGGWGSDQLGQDVLSPGESRGYRAANTGLYDFRTVWMDGSAAEIRQVDICRASQITAYRGRLTAS